MPIYLPASLHEPVAPALDAMTPRAIVEALDRHVVGQRRAKRALAVALRNRVRRLRLAPEIAGEVTPKNILMIGPTGVGKTELARRLAQLSGSPFLKVEASKFTEVGYVGRDVESMVRDLVAHAIEMVRRTKIEECRAQAEINAEERLLDVLLPGPPAQRADAVDAPSSEAVSSASATREKLRSQLRAGLLEDRPVEIEVREKGTPTFQILSSQGVEEMDVQLKDLMPGLFGGKTKRKTLAVVDARQVILQEEQNRLLDNDQIARLAVESAETSGIIFIDEIDKVAGREGGHGPDISREGVQRDLLPIVEGTSVATKYGAVRTDHILFIAAGAFHVSKPSDLIPELQGRFPIRVELEPLSQDDLVRILIEPKSALLKQYQALLETDGVQLEFSDAAVREIARLATEVNTQTENIGARRLATILETLLDEAAFDAGDAQTGIVRFEASDVRERLESLARNPEQSRFIL